jgi:CheY-like chemotaxis protein
MASDVGATASDVRRRFLYHGAVQGLLAGVMAVATATLLLEQSIDLVVSDINMPRMDGREALQAIKSHSSYSTIPVAVLTTSREESDVVRSYKAGANAFISKPVNFNDFVEVLKCFTGYWTGVVQLPPNCKRHGMG